MFLGRYFYLLNIYFLQKEKLSFIFYRRCFLYSFCIFAFINIV
ncbi:hypothetical protein HMPREF9018_0315 [Prevotella amnii CRIS 21A-A]|uniref:Uncharacterized protein n=1 Tax=Prevotella amnii CRIS 21A-A TaxID=679191 RepID=E1GWA1_9BACT|nr:hypothetical protein HMPREF9018_0315 [Prevotella amnii CRIS 21A-A]